MQVERKDILIFFGLAIGLLAYILGRANLSIWLGSALFLIGSYALYVAYGWVLKLDSMPIAKSGVGGKNKKIKALKRVINLIPQPILLLSPDLQVMHYNAPAKSIFPNVEKQRSIADIIRVPIFLESLQAAISGQAVPAFTIRHPQDHTRIYEIQLIPVEIAFAERVDKALLVEVLDRTELRRADTMRKEFIANASHELRTPMTSILGGLETIEAAENTAEKSKALAHFMPSMLSNARRMQCLVDDLASLSKIESREHIFPENIIDLQSVLKEALAGLPEHSGKIVNAFGDTPAYVYGSTDQIIQVITNLVENGRIHGGQEIEINRLVDDPDHIGMIGLEVRDFGAGIAYAHISRLTERFYRVPKTGTDEPTGTGLGLAIVKHILRRHRGDLVIDSTPGQGAAFTFYLNAASESADS